MSIEQIYTIRKVSNGYILEFEREIPAEEPDDAPDIILEASVFSEREELLRHLDSVLRGDEHEQNTD